jgi:hypothetical protein
LQIVEIGAQLAAIGRLGSQHLQLGPGAKCVAAEHARWQGRADFHVGGVDLNGREQIAQRGFGLARHAADVVGEQNGGRGSEEIGGERHIRGPGRQRGGTAVDDGLGQGVRAVFALVRKKNELNGPEGIEILLAQEISQHVAELHEFG